MATRLRHVMDDPQAFATVLAALIAAITAIAVAVIMTGGAELDRAKVKIEVQQDQTTSELERAP